MDAVIAEAAEALAAGNLLSALNHVALRNDAPALALRGVAMARLGDFPRARELLQGAARAFGPKNAAARAFCILAEAEIALVTRDLSRVATMLDSARATLEAHGDRANAAHARHLLVRHSLLVGRLDEAEAGLALLDPAVLSPALRAAHELAVAGIALRRLRTGPARSALGRARRAARQAGIPALLAEVETASTALTAPAARLVSAAGSRSLRLREVEALLASGVLVVDACRQIVRRADTLIHLARRPVLFALARALAEGWPGDVARADLLIRTFGARSADESHRARLRVEIGRLRRALRALATVDATSRGFALTSRDGEEVVVLAPPVDEEHAALLALLADGEAWSSSALALTLGVSQRTVQRALDGLGASGRVQSVGRGRACRWTSPVPAGITTTLLLPAPLPGG